VLSVFHATTQTFDGTPAVKIIENHLGKAFVKMERTVSIPIVPTSLQIPTPPQQPPNRKGRGKTR
jgi:hypothetical protein